MAPFAIVRNTVTTARHVSHRKERNEQGRGNEGRLIMMTSSVASECFIVTGSHASRELEIVLSRGVSPPLKVPPAGRGRHCRPCQELAAGPGLQRRQFKICIEKEPRARYTTKRSTRKRNHQAGLGQAP